MKGCMDSKRGSGGKEGMQYGKKAKKKKMSKKKK